MIFGDSLYKKLSKKKNCYRLNCPHNSFKNGKWEEVTIYRPGCAPRSITCNLDTNWPALNVFVAKEIKTDRFSFPGTCHKTQFNFPQQMLIATNAGNELCLITCHRMCSFTVNCRVAMPNSKTQEKGQCIDVVYIFTLSFSVYTMQVV